MTDKPIASIQAHFSELTDQGQLYKDVELLFDGSAANQLPDIQTDTIQTGDGNQGRVQTRTAITISDPSLIAPLRGSENFVNLNTVVKDTAHRAADTETTVKSRYYISSLPTDAGQLLDAARTHGSIEN